MVKKVSEYLNQKFGTVPWLIWATNNLFPKILESKKGNKLENTQPCKILGGQIQVLYPKNSENAKYAAACYLSILLKLIVIFPVKLVKFLTKKIHKTSKN